MLNNGKNNPGMTAPENNNDIVQIKPRDMLALFAETMKQERIKRNLSQERLADLANVSKDTVRRYENGTVNSARLDVAFCIASVLDISLDDIMLRMTGKGNNKSMAKQALTILMNYVENNEQ